MIMEEELDENYSPTFEGYSIHISLKYWIE